MFSPSVRRPFTNRPGSASNFEYWFARLSVEQLELALIFLVPPLAQDAAPSDFEPWSSKPWPISWPITAPMPP
jgi:hypothetical protein